jgi:intraflagellar transport protein 20
MSLKKIILIFSILFGIALNAQDIEIKYLNRVCSLGEGQCSKIYIPIDNEKEFIKLLKEYFDSKGAAFVKKEKNVAEIQFTNARFDQQKVYAINEVLNAGRRLEWYMQLFDNDNKSIQDTDLYEKIGRKLYNKVVWNLYKDTIETELKKLKILENTFEKEAKNSNKSEKKSEKSLGEALKLENEIDALKKENEKLKSSIPDYKKNADQAKSEMNDYGSNEKEIKKLENEVEATKKELKNLNKTLKDGEKNGNVDAAAQEALKLKTSNLQEAFLLQEKEADTKRDIYEKAMKKLEKNYDKAKDKHRDAEKELSSNEKTIENNLLKIKSLNTKSEENQAQANKFQNEIKSQLELDIEMQRQHIEKIKNKQVIYKTN